MRTQVSLIHANLLQVAQALSQQTGGHARHASMQVVEALAAAQQLAHHQRRPAAAQCFGAAGDGAELTVAVVHRQSSG
jgi:hypothetical protein